MSDEAAFLAAIKTTPRDDAPRLVYADWLDDQGRADEAAAIRAEQQIRTARARWDEVRPRLDPDWLARVFPVSALVLRAYPPDRKIAVIKLIREITGAGLAEAKALSEALPARLKGRPPLDVFEQSRADHHPALASYQLTLENLERMRAAFAALGVETEIEYTAEADAPTRPPVTC